MKQGGADPAAQGSRSLAKGLQILEMLAEAQRPLSLTEIAKAAGLGKVSTLRLVRTLQASGHLLRDAEDNYRVEGDWPSSRTQILLRVLREAAGPVMKSLNEQFGESIALAFLYGDHIRVVDVVESPQHIRMSNSRGRILQPYASSLGKAITAFQEPGRVTSLLDTYGVYPLTAHTITSLQGIMEELQRVRGRGYAWDRAETVEGGQCIGAPIKIAGEGVVAALSLSMPKLRFTEELEQVLPHVIRQAADAIQVTIHTSLHGGKKPDARKTAKKPPANGE